MNTRFVFASITIALLGGSAIAQENPKAEKTTEGVKERLNPDRSVPFLQSYYQQMFAAKENCPGFKTSNTQCATCHKSDVTGRYFQTQPLSRWNTAEVTWNNHWSTPTEELGATLVSADESLRSQLGLTSGLVVAGIQEGGRAARAGFKTNDILLSLAGQPLSKPEDLLSILKSWSQQHPADSYEVKILRAGKPTSIKIKAEVRVVLAPASEQVQPPDYFIGTPANPLDATFRAHLDIPEGTGLIVGEISEGTPAAKAGVKTGDILLHFAGEPLPDVEALRAKIQAKGPHPAKLEVLRAGKRITLTITPEARKQEAVGANGEGTGFITPTWVDLVATANRDQGFTVLQQIPQLRQLYSTDLLTQPINDASRMTSPTASHTDDLTKKIDELTAQVQSLTMAVEALKAAQGEKK